MSSQKYIPLVYKKGKDVLPQDCCSDLEDSTDESSSDSDVDSNSTVSSLWSNSCIEWEDEDEDDEAIVISPSPKVFPDLDPLHRSRSLETLSLAQISDSDSDFSCPDDR